MKYKLLTLCIIWFGVSVFWVIIFSVQDKEWWIGQGEIKNICDLVYYIEEDDSRNTGIIFSLPVFFPAVYAIFIKKITTGLSGSPHWLLLVTGYGNFYPLPALSVVTINRSLFAFIRGGCASLTRPTMLDKV
ncbi:DUF2645 family protein [Cronobacter sakazakii]|uniref:DUF2645 family protein n=1 Tax=Cronobacter sakazakii TaxID=28141 RepID=UPI001F24319B|nr:DUF2645 family protein [Cronobacter sakazakii]